jgi:multidrug efflux pump
MVISLTTTPMMCAKLLRAHNPRGHGRIYNISEHAFDWLLAHYESSLKWVLRHAPLVLAIALATLALNIYLFMIIPKGFFPEQDTGRLMGAIMADQDISFQGMRQTLTQFVNTVKKDPAVDHVIGFAGANAGAINSARMFIALKPLDQRIGAQAVIGRLRKSTARIPGAALYLQATQDLRVGGRSSNAEYQYTLQGENLDELNQWGPKLVKKLGSMHIITDVNSDQENHGLGADLVIDRDMAYRLGLNQELIDNTLYDAFGQRQVSTMYRPLNQYHVVEEVAPQYWQDPATLKQIDVRTPNGSQVKLSTFTHYGVSTTPLEVNHQGQFPSVTISFNLAPGVSLGQAVNAINSAERSIGLPTDIIGSFQGTAQAFQASLANESFLILAALGAVYIVLGILYESYVHPITILSTLPSAGVGALLALMLFHIDLTIIALIGIVLLIGIVKKNAILMIDFALEAERKDGKNSIDAIYEACTLRFRPIMMTTMAAMLGGLPLALGGGTGSELRRPLGVAIVGGLLVSQLLTLYTTPVIYLYLDRFRLWVLDHRRRIVRKILPGLGRQSPAPSAP